MEAMAVESLVASVWKLQGFLTVVRHPLRVDNGYSDVDAIGLKGRSLRIAECKVRGPAQRVSLGEKAKKWALTHSGSMGNVNSLFRHPPSWIPDLKELESVGFHLVGNVWFETDEQRATVEKELLRSLQDRMPDGSKAELEVSVIPTIDLISEALDIIRKDVVDDRWGRRYGDPLLDALREIIRFSHAKPVGGRGMSKEISRYTRNSLCGSIFGEV